MHSISIKVKKSADLNNVLDCFWTLLSNLRHSGQLVGRDMNPYYLQGKIMATIVTATEDALDEKYQNTYVKKTINELETLCRNSVETKFVGHSENQENAICNCKKHKHFLLRYFNELSPIECGTCFKAVPLFKIKKIKDDGYEPITSWMSNMLACVLLDINCTVGEKWAIKQQSHPNTELSKQGLSVVKLITEKTKTPCYYYLHNYAKRSIAKDNARPCPSCNGEWILKKEIHKYVWFKCDECCLMSGKTTNS
jgi:predicted  nucleic acid-binding Zn ribbon protein